MTRESDTRFMIWLVLAALIFVSQVGNQRLRAESPTADYFDLGTFERRITTDSPAAQTWFDRGLAMCYAFNHEEGSRCFEKAYAADPSCPMTLWGLAYSLCPNINNLDIPEVQISRADMAMRLALLNLDRVSPVEQDLIQALAKRCKIIDSGGSEQRNGDYADAMRAVHHEYPDDPDVAALFAESLMMLRPWKHYDQDGKPAPETDEIVKTLESARRLSPDHPALCHFYIHTVEMSPTPERASDAADRLRDAMPDAGHLVHMPSHIDVHLGDYAQVIETNLKAIEVDKKFIRTRGRNNFYTYYRIHNYHFAVYGAMFDGQSELALRMANAIPGQIPDSMLKEQTDFLDAFIPTTLHVMIRFGLWDEILEQPEPKDYLPMTRSVWHYARGLAYAAKDMVPEAESEQLEFQKSFAKVPETSFLFNNKSQDILGVAESMLDGEIEYRRENYDQAFRLLREAVRRDDSLNYDEPWGWMQPARHALGALLLEQGRLDEAEAVYREDLKRHPGNLWSLQGLGETLEKQGQTAESESIRQRLVIAAARADVSIDRSCFCRQSGAEDCCVNHVAIDGQTDVQAK